MSISLKKITIERKKIASVRTKRIIEHFMHSNQSITFLDRLNVPLEKVLKKYRMLDVRIISFKIESRTWKDDVSQFRNEVLPELKAEQIVVARSLGANHFSLVMLNETNSADVKRMRFKTFSRALYCIIISFPETLRDLLIFDETILDKFEFDRYRIRSFHVERMEALGRWVRATWRNKPVTEFNPVKSILIDGYTDLVGTEKYNKGLAEKRAKEVYKFLKPKVNLINGVDLYIVPAGEKDPVEETTEPSERNRRVVIGLLHYDSDTDKDLKKVEDIILKELKNDKAIVGTDMEEEIKCIASKLTDLKYDDRFFMYSSPGDKFNEYLLPHLRTVLVAALLIKIPNKDLYELLKFHIDLIKFEAKKVARMYSKYAIGGGGSVNRNDAKRMDFINDRICAKDPPSLIGCLKGFEQEGALWTTKPC